VGPEYFTGQGFLKTLEQGVHSIPVHRSPREIHENVLISRGRGSAAEVQSQLYTALDLGYLSEDEFQRIFQELETLSKQVSKLISYLRKAD